MTNKDMINRVLDKLDKIDDKMDKHGENISALLTQTKSTQKELSEHKTGHDKPLKEHKGNHKWWITLTVMGSGVVMGIIAFVFGGK